jgi:hypothetical protein
MLAVIPEMLLLHKAFTVYRAKGDHEFERIRDRLTADQWAWLRRQMELMLPKHRWLPSLAQARLDMLVVNEPAERGAQVVVLAFQAFQPMRSQREEKLRFGVFCHHQEILGMAALHFL